MKKFLSLSLISLFTTILTAQKELIINQNQFEDNSIKGGVPSSRIVLGQELLSGTNSVALKLTPNHSFSCFGIGWQNSNVNLALDLFQVRYRSRNSFGEWTKWYDMGGEIKPNETPTEMFWTDAIFTNDASSHKELEIIIKYPETPTSIKIVMFDGNARTAEDDLPKMKPTQSDEKSATCPGFPSMITRSQWCGGAASCSQVNTTYTPTYIDATHVIIHHGATPDTYTSGQEIVQSYYNYHVNTLGWTDIGYNYLVDKNGNFFQGRYNPNITTSDVRGAHAGTSNGTSIGINFPGNADITLATTAQLDKVKHLLAWWFDFKGLDPLSSASFQTQDFGIQTKPRICGHRDIGQTACPGNDLYARLPDLRTSANQIITDCNACGIPTGLLASSITHNSATLNWTAANNAVSYTIQYKPTNSSTWTTTNSTTNSKIISGLNASTSYEFKVMSSCSGNTSSYSSVKTFSTLAPPQVTLTMNSGTTAYSGHPYSSSYMDELSQYIITKQELTAAGWTAQTPVLKSIAFQVSTNSTTVLNSFTIKVTHTSAASYTNSNFLSGTTLVSTYTGTITTTNGWNTYT
ncbi:MAG: N-acetylmuramoyl-L-alanine amidase, partial [Crocinitomicaceae bacterium]